MLLEVDESLTQNDFSIYGYGRNGTLMSPGF